MKIFLSLSKLESLLPSFVGTDNWGWVGALLLPKEAVLTEWVATDDPACTGTTRLKL